MIQILPYSGISQVRYLSWFSLLGLAFTFTGENFLVKSIADEPNSIHEHFFSKMSGSVIIIFKSFLLKIIPVFGTVLS